MATFAPAPRVIGGHVFVSVDLLLSETLYVELLVPVLGMKEDGEWSFSVDEEHDDYPVIGMDMDTGEPLVAFAQTPELYDFLADEVDRMNNFNNRIIWASEIERNYWDSSL